MDLVAAWLLYPLALSLLSLALGLLVARLADWEMPGLLLLPAGFAALLAVTRLTVESSTTAPFALGLLVILAAAGLVLGRARLRAMRPDPLIALAALGAFAVFAAPIVLSGSPTFAGYLALADTSHHLGLADLYANHGPDASALPIGSDRLSMASYVGTAYPVAGQAALGVTAPLGIIDLAWLYQPLLSLLAIVVSLAIAAVVAPLLARRWQVAVVAFLAAQPALVVGFALQGSIKELTALAMFVTVAALIVAAARDARPPRALLPAAVAAVAALGALGPVAGVYLVVPLLAVAAVWGRRLVRERRLADVGWLAAVAAVAVVLALPTLTSLQTAVDVNSAVLDSSSTGGAAGGEDLGNLAAPLKAVQGLGVWLSGDYRYVTEEHEVEQDILLWGTGILALLGLLWLLRRRAHGPLLLVATLGLPAAYLVTRGSPYADAKVLAILSTAGLLVAALGAVVLWHRWLRPLAAILVVGLVGGVLWSNALAYHDVSLTPYDRYSEQLQINDMLAGRGPMISNEYDAFAKYFLRDVPTYSEYEWPHDYRHGPYEPNALVDPRRRPYIKTPLDMDDLRLRYLNKVNYVLIRRSPAASRPPANYRLRWRGRFYDVWKRTSRPRVVSHKPLGRDFHTPDAPLHRAQARSWAQRAQRLGGRIAYVQRRRMVRYRPTQAQLPGRWFPTALYPAAVVAAGPGRQQATFEIPRTGDYRMWIEGSFVRGVRIMVDGKPTGAPPSGLNNPGAYARRATLRLKRGTHKLFIVQGGGDLRPGSGGYRSSLRHLGPIVFAPIENESPRVRTIDPADWRRLVGKRLDWLEIVT